jgi:prepilin-type N-terminal cleavage/methylation domain-containing protein
MQNETNKLRLPKGNLSLTGFTLLELVVVIVIIGILATLGYNQYALVVEKSRIAEAIQRIGTMRQLAYEYYLKNGSLGGMTEADVGVNRLEPCSDKGWYVYSMNNYGACANLDATRCTQGGKPPNAARTYYFYYSYCPGWLQLSQPNQWHCYYPDDGSSCFGLPP